MKENEDDNEVDKKEVFDNVKKKNDKVSYSRHPERPRGTVCFDNIRKDLINREKKSQTRWSMRFGHLSSENFKKVLKNECENIGIDIDNFEEKKKNIIVEKESPILIKSSPIIPRTSAGVVGWRSSMFDCSLECFGRLYVSPTRTIEPPRRPGEFRVDNQKFIFLG